LNPKSNNMENPIQTLKAQAKQLMLEGNVDAYVKKLTEIDQAQAQMGAVA